MLGSNRGREGAGVRMLLVQSPAPRPLGVKATVCHDENRSTPWKEADLAIKNTSTDRQRDLVLNNLSDSSTFTRVARVSVFPSYHDNETAREVRLSKS